MNLLKGVLIMNTYLKKLIFLLFSLFTFATFSLSDTTMLVEPAPSIRIANDGEDAIFFLYGNTDLLL